jgi:hypothetical protein
LAKPGAEKSQLGVFGCSEAIGAIYFCILSTVREIFKNNENDPREAGPRDVAQERGELLYHLLCYVFIIDGFYMSDMMLMLK